MLKIGNDIVNISIERCINKHLEQKFLQRVFNDKEREVILNSTQPSKSLWAIWAAKEACFKACQKQQLDLIFSHKKFVIDFPKTLSNKNIVFKFGLGNYQNKSLSIKWHFNANIIHAIAVLFDNNNKLFHSWDKIKYNIFRINSTNYAAESLSTKLLAKKFLLTSKIKCCFLKEHSDLAIIRQTSIINNKVKRHPPELFIKDQQGVYKLSNVDISLSHDHGWGAVAFYDPNGN